MKYKVGDKVRVKDGLKVDKEYGCDVFVSGMERYKVVTICDVSSILCKYSVKENNFSYTDEMLAGVIPEKKIVITSDGKTTTAKLYEHIDGKRVVKSATALCSDDDEFNFLTGARIAVDRLLGDKVTPSKKFTPHIEGDNSVGEAVNYGSVGEKTPFNDARGSRLFVGDVVELFDKQFDKSYGEVAIVKKDNKYFPMGVMPDKEISRMCRDCWLVLKVRDWSDVKDGENIDGIVYRLTEGK